MPLCSVQSSVFVEREGACNRFPSTYYHLDSAEKQVVVSQPVTSFCDTWEGARVHQLVHHGHSKFPLRCTHFGDEVFSALGSANQQHRRWISEGSPCSSLARHGGSTLIMMLLLLQRGGASKSKTNFPASHPHRVQLLVRTTPNMNYFWGALFLVESAAGSSHGAL